MAEQEDDEVCEAKLDDRDSVMAIDDDVYDGIDFLPDTYSSLLQQEDVRCYLYKRDGKIVSRMNTLAVFGFSCSDPILVGEVVSEICHRPAIKY